MGQWSDGVDVLPLLIHLEALQLNDTFARCKN
jgi:hypothetical protein